MIVQIRDRDALASISTARLRTYLNASGWTNAGIWGQRSATVFAREHEGRTWEILVPHRNNIGGYAENMADSLAVLATVEGRSQLDVFHDIAVSGADAIRIRPINGKAGKSLSLRRSAGLLNGAYGMLEAGARAAEKPRAVYRGKPSNSVAEYLDSVHPLPGYAQGQSLTLHLPAPAGFEREESVEDNFHAPFPRLVAVKLALGLQRSGEALENAVAENTLEPFREAVDSGVSANLCDSLAELAKQSAGVAIDLAWANGRPSNAPDSGFRFSPAAADILTEAAKALRRNEPSYNEQVAGLVVRVGKEQPEFDGRATIASVWDGRLTRLDVKFEPEDYDLVISAFRGQAEVSLRGDIHPSSGGYELRNPRNLSPVLEE